MSTVLKIKHKTLEIQLASVDSWEPTCMSRRLLIKCISDTPVYGSIGVRGKAYGE